MIPIMSDAFTLLFDPAEPRRLDPGARLFHAGDAVRNMYLVAEGAVNLTRVTHGGSPVTLQSARPGQVVAEASAYSATYHCDALAVTTSLVNSISVADFRARLTADPSLAEGWAAHLAHTVQTARLRAEIRTLRTVAERLDAWIGEGRALPAKGSLQDLAAELGVSREALYRELSRRRQLHS